MQWLLFTPGLPPRLCVPGAVCLSASRAQQAGTPHSTAVVSLAEMKRLLALSHERKFPSKCIKRVCRGEFCVRGRVTELLPPSAREVTVGTSMTAGLNLKSELLPGLLRVTCLGTW